MGYRFLVALCALALMCSCAAFDHDSEPYTGFNPNLIPPASGGQAGIYTGYYDGDMTMDSNSCAAVSDEIGVTMSLALDVLHKDTVVNLIFEDGTVAAGSLEGNRATFMTETSGVRHIYYLTFADETMEGSCEIFEADADGNYKDPCGSYTVSLKKGERPAEEDMAEEGEEL